MLTSVTNFAFLEFFINGVSYKTQDSTSKI